MYKAVSSIPSIVPLIDKKRHLNTIETLDIATKLKGMKANKKAPYDRPPITGTGLNSYMKRNNCKSPVDVIKAFKNDKSLKVKSWENLVWFLRQMNYYPDEENGWILTRNSLEDSYSQAEADGVNIRAIVIINPGNPTGSVLTKESVDEVVAFSSEKGIVIIADEVYQENTYGSKFHSFAKAVWNRSHVPLFSLHSVSKGFYGECGHRGGYLEVRNSPKLEFTDQSLNEVLFRQASVNLCSNTVGQVLVYLMVTPPPEKSVVGKLHKMEVKSVLKDLQEKALIIKQSFTEMEGVQCFGEIGALYLFPRLDVLPDQSTDFDYCMALLESTGLSTVNGGGFGQKEGTHHLRIAFLPLKLILEEALPKWIEFHQNFIK